MINKNKIYIFDSTRFCTKKIKERTLLYNNEDCEVICANETGRTILDKLDGKKTINEIIVEISVEYDLPETVVEEYINDFIEHLAMNKIVLDKQDDTKELKKNTRGINRLYIEMASATSERSMQEFQEILGQISFYSKEKEIKLFLNCEKLDSQRIFDILSIAMKYDCFFVYSTIKPCNFPRELIQLSAGNKKIKYIIPLYHSDEFQNDKQVFPGYYKKFHECIKEYLANSITCYLGLTITSENEKVLNDMQQQAFDLGMAGIILNDYNIDNADCLLELYQNNTFLNSWKNNRIKKRSNYFPIMMYKGFCQNGSKKLQKKRPCGIGCEELYVNINNKVFPCHKLNGTSYYYNSINEYLDNREKDYSDQIISEECKKCFAWSICLGGCKAINIMEGLPINAVARDCKIKKKIIQKKIFGE